MCVSFRLLQSKPYALSRYDAHKLHFQAFAHEPLFGSHVIHSNASWSYLIVKLVVNNNKARLLFAKI